MKKMMMLTTTAYMSERFNRSNIEVLESLGYEVHVVANFDKGNPTTKEVLDEFRTWVENHHGKCFSISVTNNPVDLPTLNKAYREVIALIEEHKYEFIHCHTPVAGVLGRIAAHNTKTKVMYTAHGFHFYKGAPLLNWMIYYPVERFLGRWTDVLLTINKEDYQRAQKTFGAKQIEYIPGIGIDLEKFDCPKKDRDRLREETQLKKEDIMLLSVGELNKNKNHEIVVRAIATIDDARLHYYIAGQGKLGSYLENLIKELGMEKQVHLLGFRKDIALLLQATDVFVFPSKREGLSVALMEAIGCRVPVICSAIRGNTDLIKDSRYTFNPQNKAEVVQCILNVVDKQNSLVVEQNYEVLKQYGKDSVNMKMKEIYRRLS